MALTHVCIWDPQVGYRRISIEEACEMYPYKVPANQSQFVCELCAQNIGVSKKRVDTGTRYFFHSSAAQDKYCEDRQLQLSRAESHRLVSLNICTMPLRLTAEGSTFFLQLGFFYPPDHRAHCDKIKIASDSHQVYEYSFERIEPVGITYLNIGSIPSQNYWLEYINANVELKRFWSNRIPGINATGSFFDGRTGQILQSGGKAYSSNFYYLLQRYSLTFYPPDIEAPKITSIQADAFTTWHLYEIRVKKFSVHSARFFLKYDIFLTEKPTRFYPIWPPYIEDPHFIYHNSSEFYFYLCGDDAELKSYPAVANGLDTHDGKLYKLHTRDREQLISLGKSGALGFSYLIKQPLNKEAPLPEVVISDHAGNDLTEEIYTKLPKSKLISVSCQYDGKAVVQKKGHIDRVYKLSAEQSLLIDGLSFGTEIHFYQGCDCVRTIRFEPEKSCTDISAADKALIEKLKACRGPTIPVSHAIAAIANKYAEYPQTRQWVYTALRQAEMPRKALQLLKSNTPNNCRRDNNG